MLGDAGKKIQTIVELAEDVYEKVTALREDLEETTETVEETNGRVEALESEVRRQGAILEALAEERGIDLDAIDAADSGVDDGSADPAGTGAATDDAPHDRA